MLTKVSATAGSCEESADELSSRAMVSAGPRSPDGEERSVEPREPTCWVLPALGEGWSRPEDRAP